MILVSNSWFRNESLRINANGAMRMTMKRNNHYLQNAKNFMLTQVFCPK